MIQNEGIILCQLPNSSLTQNHGRAVNRSDSLVHINPVNIDQLFPVTIRISVIFVIKFVSVPKSKSSKAEDQKGDSPLPKSRGIC
jgi:hypothetical protein